MRFSSVDLQRYRASPKEQARIADLMELTPDGQTTILEVGARDGYISRRLTEKFDHVVSLDLEKPEIDVPGIEPVKGDVTALDFGDDSFDVVMCAEVLEHIPPNLLQKASDELTRVTRNALIIGVPFEEDLRVGETTCSQCRRINPPWGHVNSFSSEGLKALFRRMHMEETRFVGTTRRRTNWLSTALMRMAGNPWGTYAQEEPCVWCGATLAPPTQRSLVQKLCGKGALLVQRVQEPFISERGNWIHVRFTKIHS